MNARAALITVVAAASLCGFLAACSGDNPDALLASAKDYLAKNDRKAAVIQLKNALEKRPDFAEARFLLGSTLLEAGDIPSAEKELRRARELKYPAGQVDPALAAAWAKLGEYQKVVDTFAQAQGGTPTETAQLKTAIGQAQLGLGKPDLAKAAFDEAQRVDPSYAPALVGEAVLVAREGDLAGALLQAEKAIAAAPQSPEAWQIKGDLLLAQNKNAEAIDAYRKVIAIKPDYLTAHWALIAALVRDGKTADADQAVVALKAVAPKHPQTHYYEALVRSQEKNFTAARDAIQQQLAVDPENLTGVLLSAAIDYELHAYDRAEASLLKVIAQTPQNDYARRLLVNTLLQTRQPGRALDALKPMLTRIGSDAGMQNVAGEVYLQNGDPASAAEYFEKAAALDPKGPRQKTGLALTRLAQGDTVRGVKELEAAAAVDPGARSDLMLIAVALRRHDWQGALNAVDALEKKQPKQPLGPNLRGLALLGKGDVAGARASFEHALSFDPNYFPAIASLARLDLAEKKPKDAQKRFEDLLVRKPGNGQALLSLAEIRAGSGAPPDEVNGLIDKAIRANPKDVEPRVAMVRNYLRVKEPRKAVLAAQDALAAIPGRSELLDSLGQAQQAAGDTSDALTTFKRFAEVSPDSPTPYLRMAALQVATKKFDGAGDSYRHALAIKPDLIEAQKGLAAIEANSNRLPEALAVAKDIQKQRPKESVGYLVEGDVYASKRDWPKALAAYRAAMSHAGATESAVKVNAVLVASGQGAEADKMAVAWLRDHPADDAFRFSLAELAGERKDYANSMRYYGQVLQHQPDNPVLLNNIAWVAGQVKDPKALEYAEKANKLAPDQPRILDTLGTLLVEKGDTARGLPMLQKAVQMAPDISAIRLNLARALVKAGQNDAAKKELDTLAGLGDKFRDQDEVTRLRKGL
ncbi:MAG: XrtA/PEP-CTERM system TPR-repeat protein PrsT [Betaproteobacteria bacterium]